MIAAHIEKKGGIFRFRGSIVASISACHADDRGSIPRHGVFLYFSHLYSIHVLKSVGAINKDTNI